MTAIGLCTHFTETDAWAFEFALERAKARGWQLNICHWLHSPYKIRRDIVRDDLFHPKQNIPATPSLLNKLELQLRDYYEPKLGDFTDVAFKLCEGQYQVELVRCFRNNLLNLVVMGYQPPQAADEPGILALEDFAMALAHPLIIVGQRGPDSYLLNLKAVDWLDQLSIPDDGWEIIQPETVSGRS